MRRGKYLHMQNYLSLFTCNFVLVQFICIFNCPGNLYCFYKTNESYLAYWLNFVIVRLKLILKWQLYNYKKELSTFIWYLFLYRAEICFYLESCFRQLVFAVDLNSIPISYIAAHTISNYDPKGSTPFSSFCGHHVFKLGHRYTCMYSTHRKKILKI